MKAEIRKLPKSEIEIEIELSPEEFEKIFEDTVLALQRDLEIEGFRKGKVPREILEKEFGKEKILEKARERTIKESYLEVVLENKLEVISQPKIEILSPSTFKENTFGQTKSAKSGGGFGFKARVAVMPKIELPDYQKIASQIKKREVFVQSQEIEDALNWLCRSRAKFSQVEREAKFGDFVEIEYRSQEIGNGKPLKDAFILGQGHLIEGFEEKLEGMRKGQEKNFSLKFPEAHFQKELAKKEVNFEVKMVSVQKIELPEINNQLAKTLGQFEDLNSLRESLREGIKVEKETLERRRIRQEILNEIGKEISRQIPEILIEAEKKRMAEDLKNLIRKKFQIGFGEYLAKIQKSEKEIEDSFWPGAERKIKELLILKEIAKTEKIEVGEDEIKREINQFLKNSPERNLAELDFEKLKDYYKEAIRDEKVFQFLENLVQK